MALSGFLLMMSDNANPVYVYYVLTGQLRVYLNFIWICCGFTLIKFVMYHTQAINPISIACDCCVWNKNIFLRVFNFVKAYMVI